MDDELTRRNFLKITGAAVLATHDLEILADEQSRKIVVLDPGHGMGNRNSKVYDPGTVYDGIYESRLVMEQAILTGELLPEYDFLYTRNNETTETPLGARAIFANNSKANIFVSLHINASEDPNAQGVRVYHFPGSLDGQKLAKSIYNSLVKELTNGVSNFRQDCNGVRQEKFRVLKQTSMSAVLVESGFLTNPRDRKYLTENPKVIARGIANGILDYFS